MEGDLSKFLRLNIFPLIDVPKEYVDKLLSPEHMPDWEAAFTHESYNRNIGQNYDHFEKLGDSVLGTCYTNFLMQNYANLTSAQLSSLFRHYVSKPVLASISQDLGLPSMLRTSVTRSMSSREDLLESFIGALFWIGNKIGNGKGFILADQFVYYIYSKIEIDMSVTKGPPKTQVKEIFDIMHWGTPIETWRQLDEGRKGVFSISFTEPAIDFFNSQGAKVNERLASAEGSTKTVASNEAYRQAILNLVNIGLTKEWADNYKRRMEYYTPELSPYTVAVEEKLSQAGFDNFYVQTAKATAEGKIVQLIGEKPDGEREILAQVSSASSQQETYRDLFNAYINS